jgi:hypothetical protein
VPKQEDPKLEESKEAASQDKSQESLESKPTSKRKRVVDESPDVVMKAETNELPQQVKDEQPFPDVKMERQTSIHESK